MEADIAPSKVVDITWEEMKGDSIRSKVLSFNVAADVATEIMRLISLSYVSKTISRLHSPFVMFFDLDGAQNALAIEHIRKIKVTTKPAAGQ